MPNAKFCASCGAPVSALPSQVAPVAPTKRKPWFWVIAVVMIILAFFGGASIAPERVVTFTATATVPSVATVTKTLVTTALAEPQRVKIGQTFILVDRDVPFEVTFTDFRYADKMGYSTPDKGYKFAILYITVKNPGTKEVSVWSYGSWTAKVDKGYVYSPKDRDLPYSFRPQEIKTGYVYFEILQDTRVIEIRCSRQVTVSADIILEP